MKRKIIQITGFPGTAEDGGTLVALADDGTLWEGYQHYYRGQTRPHKWNQIPTLPDDNSNLSKVR